MGILTKHYLNTKQWQKALDMAKNIINSGHYALQPTFQDVFSFENPKNTNRKSWSWCCLLYTSPSPRDATLARMPSSA